MSKNIVRILVILAITGFMYSRNNYDALALCPPDPDSSCRSSCGDLTCPVGERPIRKMIVDEFGCCVPTQDQACTSCSDQEGICPCTESGSCSELVSRIVSPKDNEVVRNSKPVFKFEAGVAPGTGVYIPSDYQYSIWDSEGRLVSSSIYLEDVYDKGQTWIPPFPLEPGSYSWRAQAWNTCMNTTSSDGRFIVTTSKSESSENSKAAPGCRVKLVPSKLRMRVNESRTIAAFLTSDGEFDRVNISSSASDRVGISELYDDMIPYTSTIVSLASGNPKVVAQVIKNNKVICSDSLQIQISDN